ncbi:MAG: hypothetical protein Q7Q73_08855 [Verrucomicrobiota bacterium JB024]|nr:hypothetical protein [Verrucomicrobiota bacterium JB024]
MDSVESHRGVYKRLPRQEQGKVAEFIRQELSDKVRYADDKRA